MAEKKWQDMTASELVGPDHALKLSERAKNLTGQQLKNLGKALYDHELNVPALDDLTVSDIQSIHSAFAGRAGADAENNHYMNILGGPGGSAPGAKCCCCCCAAAEE